MTNDLELGLKISKMQNNHNDTIGEQITKIIETLSCTDCYIREESSATELKTDKPVKQALFLNHGQVSSPPLSL